MLLEDFRIEIQVDEKIPDSTLTPLKELLNKQFESAFCNLKQDSKDTEFIKSVSRDNNTVTISINDQLGLPDLKEFDKDV